MKEIVLIFLCFCSFPLGLLSQSLDEDAELVQIEWKVGTTKTIHQVDSNIMFMNDSLYLATGVQTNYLLDIISEKDTIYEVRFKKINLDSDISFQSEMIEVTEIENLMQQLLISLQEKMLGFEYSFLVNKNSGLAFEVVNQKELELLIEELVVVFLNQYLDASKIVLSESETENFQLEVKEYLKEQMPAGIQTTLNTFNYLFQAYSFPYTLDKQYEVDIEVSNVDEIKFGDESTYTKVIVNSGLNKELLTIDYEYQYDLQSAYNEYVVSVGLENEVPLSEFSMTEKVISTFDLKSSWMTTSSSIIDVHLGEIDIFSRTFVTIE